MDAQPTRQTSRVAGVLASLLLVAVNSQAAPLACTGQTFTPAMTVNDMTFGSPASAATSANDCKWTLDPGGIGHNVAGINLLWGSAADPFSLLAKWDVGAATPPGPLDSRTALGFTWVLGPVAGKFGEYTLSITPPQTLSPPPTFDFVGVLKGGPGFGSWFFDNRQFSGTGGGVWTINFRNGNSGNSGNNNSNASNNTPDLSHLSIFARSVGSPPPPPPNGVPTPGTLSLVGLALLAGWAAAARRRRIARA
jgi:hypothetical protein